MTRLPVLVTDGAGLISSHTCEQLSAAGYLAGNP